MLGGCSVLNAMLYVRGAHKDYDWWALNGAPGWSWRDVRKYFLRSEDQQDPHYMRNGEFSFKQTNIPTSFVLPFLVFQFPLFA